TLTYSEAGDEGVELPEYTVEGYTYTGWTDAETGNSFAYLTTQTGALTLSPLLSAGEGRGGSRPGI
ncbi:MAG: hypothetical protein LUE63_09090, partial [Lachnospiraceae bacterium]|nr:hypothetical protein [Lachnospiraceae bacterium]